MENKLGNFLKEKRGEMSLRDFANKLDISHTYLDSLEKGYDSRNKKPVRVTVDTLSKIAKALNEPLEKLVALSENRDYIQEDPLGLAKIGFSMKDYNPPTDKQREQLAELIKVVLKDNKKEDKEKNENNKG